jgi:hypothetical protein
VSSTPILKRHRLFFHFSGSLPAPSGQRKSVVSRPATSLWDNLEDKKGESKRKEDDVESSGNPVLDNLRRQLKKHGATGILGLARKFRIIDDDNRYI